MVYMSALDTLLGESLVSQIQDKLGKKTYQKIERRLLERYGLTIIEAMSDFQKIDATLREFFGPGADEIEKDLVENFISLDRSKGEKPWIVIHDQKLAKLMLESFGDSSKKKILDNALAQPNVILDILESCKIPKSSGYRVIKELIDDGFLAERGFATTKDGKKVNKYVSIFENLKFDIQGNKVIAKMQINEDFLKESYIIKVIQGR